MFVELTSLGRISSFVRYSIFPFRLLYIRDDIITKEKEPCANTTP
jgi:hypothetical protein